MPPVTASSTPATLPTVAGSSRRAACERVVRDLVGAVAGQRDRDGRDRVVGARVDLDRARSSRRSRAPACFSPRDRGCTAAADVLGLDRDDRRVGAAGERAMKVVVRLMIAGLGKPSSPGCAVCRLSAGMREGDEHAGRRRPPRRAGGAGRGRGPRPRRGLAVSPRSRPRNGMRPFSTRSPSFESSAGSTVSEPSMATATTSIVADREGHERLVAGEEHAGHRDQDGHARDQHGPPRGGRRGLERRGSLRAGARAPRARGGCRRASSRRRRRARSGG